MQQARLERMRFELGPQLREIAGCRRAPTLFVLLFSLRESASMSFLAKKPTVFV